MRSQKYDHLPVPFLPVTIMGSRSRVAVMRPNQPSASWTVLVRFEARPKTVLTMTGGGKEAEEELPLEEVLFVVPNKVGQSVKLQLLVKRSW